MKRIKKILLVTIIVVLVAVVSQASVDKDKLVIETDPKEKVEIKDSMTLSTYDTLLRQISENELEDSYNLKDNLNEIRVKDQKNSQACWAFSFSSVLETSVAKQYNKIAKEYSPMHIEYVTSQMFNRALGSGAGPRLSVAYATSARGPVEENEMPFESVYTDESGYKQVSQVGSLDKPLSARIFDTKEFSAVYKELEDGQIKYYKNSGTHESGVNEYSEEEIKVNRDAVKKHIKESGAVSADMHMVTSSGDLQKYYNETNAAFNYNNYENVTSATSNHVIALVGWDDNYDKNNFNEASRPVNNGAYIALNSYGSDWGKQGYFYISYEDACIETGLMGIDNIKEFENNELDYDKLYQYDELGMNLGIAMPDESKTLYAANKFKRQSTDNKDEYLTEVGVYIASTSDVEVYVNPDSDDIEAATIKATANSLETGYHVIKLPNAEKLTGDTFAIKIKYTSTQKAQIPLEVNYKTYGATNTSDFFDGATSSRGESYLSFDGTTWYDVFDINIRDTEQKQHSLADSNACIKAFTEEKEEQQNPPSGGGSGNPGGQTGGGSSGGEQSGGQTGGGSSGGQTGGQTGGSSSGGTSNQGGTGNSGTSSSNGSGNSGVSTITKLPLASNTGTTAKGILPYAGQRITVILAIIFAIAGAIIIFIKYKNLKEVK